MNQQADFYLISNQVTDARFKLASRLCNKIQRLGKKILLVTDNELNSEQLDKVLWSFSDTSFVAHDRLNQESCSNIQVGEKNAVSDAVLQAGYDVLVNLCDEVPDFCFMQSRIAEIVEQSDAAKAAARLRFKAYQERGFEIKTHDIEL